METRKEIFDNSLDAAKKTPFMFSPIKLAIAYLNRFMAFPSQDHALVSALYATATHLWPHFDAFPYLHITADTKRAGKTVLSELLGNLSANPMNIAGATAATIFRAIRDEQPTIFMDEIEQLGSETASVMRTVLNVGYRRGQTVPRIGKAGVEHWPAYCPKVFIGIGDLLDTLRDRTIPVRLVRGKPPERYRFEIARADGETLRDLLHDATTDHKNEILDAYADNGGLDFLNGRDEEIWLPLFAVCEVLAPDSLEELKRIAVDIATEKTAVARRHVELKFNETEAVNEEYGERLLRDLLAIATAAPKKYVLSADAVDLLKAIPVAPWRKFRGDGLTVNDMANLLSVHNVKPKNIKIAKNKVQRGYTREAIEKAVQALG